MARDEIRGHGYPEAKPADEFEVLPILPSGLTLLHEVMASDVSGQPDGECFVPILIPSVRVQGPSWPVYPSVHHYRVSLPWQGSLDIEAVDRDDAIAAYNRVNGIISSEHKHQVEELD